MGWNFRRSFKLLPGIRLNVGKTGTSISFGVRGLRTAIGRRRTTTTVGIPGSGLSFTANSRETTSTTADVEAFKRKLNEDRRQIEESPARQVFYQRKRAEHLKALGNRVPEPGPLVCTECRYERVPVDSGPLHICPKCKFDRSGRHTRPLRSTTSVAYQLGRRWRPLLGLGAMLLVALALYLVKR
jgi:hypothetical protein